MKMLASLFAALFFSPFLFAQELNGQEQQIIQYINAHRTDAERLLEETVNINSGTLNKEGVRKVGDVFAREFRKIGFEVEWVRLPDSLQRAGHLVATRKGKKRQEDLAHRSPRYSVRA